MDGLTSGVTGDNKRGPIADAVADSEATAAGEGPRARGRAQRTGAGRGRRSRKANVSSDGACPSITHHQTRQVDDSVAPPILALDWWETAGSAIIGEKADALFDELSRAKELAELHGKPHPVNLADGQILVHARGMGAGRAAHFEYRFEWLGMTVGLSARQESSRQMPNFYVKIPGEPCVIHGADPLRRRLASFLSEFDIIVMDEWFRRIDICLDLPGWSFAERVSPACEAKQYFGSLSTTAPHRKGASTTGFTASTAAVGLVIYDKLTETLSKKSEAYFNAMIQGRWGGKVPDSAMRLEYQICRGFLVAHGLNSVDKCLENLAGVIHSITRFGDHPYFVLTDCVPDRLGRHQDRAGVHPEWQAAIEFMQKLAGEPLAPLRRLERGMMQAERCVKNAIGYLTTAAAQLGMPAESEEDLIIVLRVLIRRNKISDAEISKKWADKARRAGTFETVSKRRLGNLLAV